MKNNKYLVYTVLCTMFLFLFSGTRVEASSGNQSSDDSISSGVYCNQISLGGLSEEEAMAQVSAYVESLSQEMITFQISEDTTEEISAADLALTWTNTEIIEEAVALGKEGSIIERYKAKKDLERNPIVYQMEFSIDEDALKEYITSLAEEYDVEVVNASMTKNGSDFEYIPGVEGSAIDIDTTYSNALAYILGDWITEQNPIEVVVTTVEPQGTEEELSQIKDVLGTYTTSYSTSGTSRAGNVENGASLVNGHVVYPGETFSIYDAIKPFTEANGYLLAGSYLNGKVVDSLGGGICQVSTTLYNAALLAEMEIVERHNHSMMVAYVQPGFDAAIAESAGKDFQFTNNTDYPIYIEGVTKNRKITFTIYGVETRPENRVVKYENEVLEVIQPTESVVADATQAVGVINIESAHTGYKAKLYKVVTVDGVEQSRELVNSSSYAMSPKIYMVGTASSDPTITSAVNAAIATGNMTYVQDVIAAVTAGGTTAAEQIISEAAGDSSGN